MSSNSQNQQQYSASNIPLLKPREHVRRRPGMYVGGTDKRALHHLLWEVVDDAITEAMSDQSPCNHITIELLANNRISISDNGVGIATEIDPQLRKPILEGYMTEIGYRHHIYERGRIEGTPPFGGIHGVGISVVNCLASELTIEIKRDGYLWQQSYQEGIPITDVEQVRALKDDEATGTRITFTPDYSIMAWNNFDYNVIVKRCEELAYLVQGLTISVIKDEKQATFHAPNGLADWITQLNDGHLPLHEPLSITKTDFYPFRYGKYSKIKVSLTLQISISNDIMVKGYVNSLEVDDDGTNINDLESLVRTTVLGSNPPMGHEFGLVAFVHMEHPDPQYEGTMNKKLMNEDARLALHDAFQSLVAENMETFAKIQGYLF